MAEETKALAVSDVTKAEEETTRPADASVESAVAESKSAEGGDSATAGESTEDTKPLSSSQQEPAADDTKADITKESDDTATAPAAGSAATNGTPASSKKTANNSNNNNNRRKSGATLPKKTPSKKKASPDLHLNVKPGETWMVALRGYPPWPVIICDEEMLPEALLSKRPVSAMRVDGTYREDFREGGKNAKDRRYPIMFLGTNEFAWQVNTDLQPFDLEEVKKEVEGSNQQKKSKALWEAYQIAAEGKDLAYFKELLENHEKAIQVDAEEKEAAAAKKQEKKDKAKRKSTAAEEDEDIDMEDANEDGAVSAKKAKASKKRKKGDESDGEPEKPSKTPKTKLKLNNKAPADSSASKPKKESKPKKSKAKSESAEAEPAKVEEPPMTEAERREKQEKSVLYLRHRLQKGFLTRDQAPKEEEMANMHAYFKQLEEFENLSAEVIKKTKIHKVLKAILKLSSIPREDEYQFKKRSGDILQSWTGALAADPEPATEASAPAEPATNGVKHDEGKTEGAGPIESAETKPVEAEPAKATDDDGDVAMADAKDDVPAVAPSTDAATEVANETTA